jgi:hypothetical protein
MGLTLAGLGLILALPQVGRVGLAASAAGPIYVDTDAIGGNDGGSWPNAYTELQSALDVAGPGDEIWVAEGVYKPDYDPGGGVHTGHITASFALTSGVALYGGFDPSSGANTFPERNWDAFPTVLSGDLAGDDTTTAHNVITTTAHISGSNACHVVTASGVDNTAILDGFTITGGSAEGSCSLDGGGMLIHIGSPRLTNLTFSGNRGQTGGGLHSASGNPTLTHITFIGNTASWQGGGMGNTSSARLIDVTFVGNASLLQHGGGLYNGAWGSSVLTDVTFLYNSANWTGGGMMNEMAGYSKLVDVVFSGNSADFGGGLGNYWGSPMLINVTFSGNSADEGGGIGNLESSPTLINVTFSGNSAGVGGGMYSHDVYVSTYSRPVLTNTILWGNTGDQIASTQENTSTIYYSLVEGGCPDGCVCDHIVDADPLFVRDPYPGADGTWEPGDDYGDLRLLLTSPAVDAGVNTALPPGIITDLAGEPRFFDVPDMPDTGSGTAPIVDMGAYEARLWYSHLPSVMRNHTVAPDLVVERIVATANDVQVVIANYGNASASEDFWVDAYLDPVPAPSHVNQVWYTLSAQGLVWGVTADLAPGEMLTLTVDGDYYAAEHSLAAWPLLAGTQVYAQVDSANTETTYGAVLEIHEISGDAYNNVAGPVGSTVAGSEGPSSSPIGGGR